MTRDLHEKIGEVSTENLFASLNPEPIIKPAVIKKGAASAFSLRSSAPRCWCFR